MKSTEKEVKSAAKELNALGFEPAWNPKGTAEETLTWVKNAVTFLEADDVLSDATQAVVDELLAPAKPAKAPAKKEVPASKGKKAPVAPEPEEEEEEEEDEPDDADEPEEDDEEEVPVPAKKGKAVKEAPAPAPKAKAEKTAKPAKAEKAPKVKKEKSISPTYLVRYAVCENPGISIEELQKVLKKAGADMAPISISLRKNEMVAAIAILKEQGQLKK